MVPEAGGCQLLEEGQELEEGQGVEEEPVEERGLQWPVEELEGLEELDREGPSVCKVFREDSHQ